MDFKDKLTLSGSFSTSLLNECFVVLENPSKRLISTIEIDMDFTCLI